MKKILLVSLIASSLNVAHAAAFEPSGFYIGADYMSTDIADVLAATSVLGAQTSKDETTGYSVQVGYSTRMTENLYLNYELAYSDLGTVKITGGSGIGAYRAEASAKSYGINLMPKYQFGDFYVGVIGGLNNLSADISISTTATVSKDISEWKLLTGAEVGYSFQQVGINLGYKSIDSISALYLGMDYSF